MEYEEVSRAVLDNLKVLGPTADAILGILLGVAGAAAGVLAFIGVKAKK